MPSTQYDPTSEKIPGLPNMDPVPSGSPGDPSATPQLPSITAPPQRPEADTKQPTAPNISPNKRGGTIGAVAFLGDSILRGFQRGREQAEQQKAYKTNRLIQGMQFAYQNAAKHYTDLIKNGADPNSKEVKDAAAAADAAWASMMQIYGNYIMPKDKKGKGGKGKGGDHNDPENNPIQQIQSQDPQAKLQGWYQITAKAGPPYKYEAQQYLTPEYQQQIKNRQSEGQITGDILGKRTRLHELQKIDPSQLKPEQKSELERLQADPELFPEMSRMTPHYGTSDIPGKSLVTAKDPYGNPVRDKFGNAIDPDQTYRLETIGGQQSYVPSIQRSQIAKPGSEQEYIERVAKEAGIPEKDLSAESLQQLRSSWASSGQMGKIVDQNYVYTDKDTGDIHVVKLQRSTTPQKVGTPQVHASPGSAPGSASSTAAGTPAVTPHHDHATAPIPATGSGAVSGTGSDRIIGHTQSQPDAKIEADAIKGARSLAPLAGVLKTQQQYMDEIAADPSKRTPRQDLAMVVAAVRAMNPGSNRLPKTELEWERMTGSYADRLRRWYDNGFGGGILPDDQRKDLFGIISKELKNSGKMAVDQWKQAFGGKKPVPAYLQQFDDSPASGSGAGDPSKPHAVDQILDDMLNKPKPKPQ